MTTIDHDALSATTGGTAPRCVPVCHPPPCARPPCYPPVPAPTYTAPRAWAWPYYGAPWWASYAPGPSYPPANLAWWRRR